MNARIPLVKHDLPRVNFKMLHLLDDLFTHLLVKRAEEEVVHEGHFDELRFLEGFVADFDYGGAGFRTFVADDVIVNFYSFLGGALLCWLNAVGLRLHRGLPATCGLLINWLLRFLKRSSSGSTTPH
jgi:hypothetical protein